MSSLEAPHSAGRLEVGDGHRIFWDALGNPSGKPVVMLHCGPGSGTPEKAPRAYNLAAQRVIRFDQRGCGRSAPHAGDSLAANTTHHLVADIELLREHLGYERWQVWGGSWGSTLGLAYAQRHPERVTAMVLVAVVGSTRAETAWLTRAMRRVFPEEWDRFAAGLPEDSRDSDLSTAYAELFADPDPAVHRKAAADWCAWEDSHMDLLRRREPRLAGADPRFQLCFARLVTHYWSNGAFLGETELLDGAARLNGIPGALVHGALDISSPPDFPYAVAQRWTDAELRIIDDTTRAGSEAMRQAVRAAAARFAGL